MNIAYLGAGPLIAYWVAMAAGYNPIYEPDRGEEPVLASTSAMSRANPCRYRPRVSAVTNSSGAGPIIEREHIDLISDFGQWMVRHSKREDYSRADASPLVGAMRADLMWEYVDEVPSSEQ